MEALLRSDSVEAGTPNVLGLVEGNRGLFDGLDVGLLLHGGTGAARWTAILLSLDCKMTRTALVRACSILKKASVFAAWCSTGWARPGMKACCAAL